MERLANYYSQADSDMALREIIRTLQKRAAHVQARLIRGEYKKVKKQFKTDGESVILNTQTAVRTIHHQIDTGIRGKTGKAFQKTVESTLPKYDDIID